jgi:alpha-ribazole phosphatase
MRLILIRHPKPDCEMGLCYGRLDLGCSEDALDTAALRLSALAQGHRVVTSPARRALTLAKRLSADAAIEPRLRELDFGDWEGRRWQDLGREAIDAWRAGLPHSAPPNGETLAEMGARCAEWLSALDRDGPPVLAVAHAGSIRVIRALAGGEPLLTYFETRVPFAEPLALSFY